MKKKKKKKKKPNQNTESDTSRESSLNRSGKEKIKSGKKSKNREKLKADKKSKNNQGKHDKINSSESQTSDMSSSQDKTKKKKKKDKFAKLSKKTGVSMTLGDKLLNEGVENSETMINNSEAYNETRFSRKDWHDQRGFETASQYSQNRDGSYDNYQHTNESNFSESTRSYQDNGPVSIADFTTDCDFTQTHDNDLYTDFSYSHGFPRGGYNPWALGRGPRWRGKGKHRQNRYQEWRNFPPMPYPDENDFGWNARNNGPPQERNWASHSSADERRRPWPVRDGPFIKPPVPTRDTGPAIGPASGRGRMDKSGRPVSLSQSLDRAMGNKKKPEKRQDGDPNRSRYVLNHVLVMYVYWTFNHK